MWKELEVQIRDKHGKPVVIKEVDIPRDNELVLSDNKRIGKKRLQERQGLYAKYQQRWADLYHLPKELEEAKEVRKKAEKEFEKQLPRTEERAASTTVVPYVPPTAAIEQTLPQHLKDEALIYLGVSLCVIFFTLALFPTLRSRVVAEINGSVIPQLHDTVWTVSDFIAENLPLTSGIIKTVYGVVGFWPTVGLAVLLLYQVRNLLQVVEVAVGRLSRQVAAMAPRLRRHTIRDENSQ